MAGALGLGDGGGAASVTFVRASTTRRVVAYIGDSLLLGAVGLAIWGVVDHLGIARSPANTPIGSSIEPATLAVVLLLVGMNALYFTVLWRLQQGTLAMRLLRLRVGRAADGVPLTWRQGIVRWLVLEGILSLTSAMVPENDVTYAFSGLAGITWVTILLISTIRDPMHRGLHDRWSDSMVVSEA
ncbi:MAG: RDD family protein [Chloroflexi bacterium]|nr:RDD family protein [Chloroflexota bacterium]